MRVMTVLVSLVLASCTSMHQIGVSRRALDGGSAAATDESSRDIIRLVGDGIADDTLVIQTMIDTGEPVRLPRGIYRITRTLNLLESTRILGDGIGDTVIDATGLTNAPAMQGPGNSRSIEVSNLSMHGPGSHATQPGNVAINPGHYAWNVRLDRLWISGFYDGILLSWASESFLTSVYVTMQRHIALNMNGVVSITAINSLFANSMGFDDRPANVRIASGASHVLFSGCLIDEAFGNAASVLLLDVSDVTIHRSLVYAAPGKWGIRFGDGVTDPIACSLEDVFVRPFDRNVQQWNIELHGSGHVLSNVTTATPNGGGDINDLSGGGVEYRNVNGLWSWFGAGPVGQQSATDLAGVIAALKAYGLLRQ